MSKNNNVNPDHYKAAGRLRPDDAARARQLQAKTSETPTRRAKRPAGPKPGAAAGKSREK